MPKYLGTRGPFTGNPITISSDTYQEYQFAIDASLNGNPVKSGEFGPLQSILFSPSFNLADGAIISSLAASMLKALPRSDGTQRAVGPLRVGDRFEIWVQNADDEKYRVELSVKHVVDRGYPLDQAGYVRSQLGFFVFASMDEIRQYFKIEGLPEITDETFRIPSDMEELDLQASNGSCIKPSVESAAMA